MRNGPPSTRMVDGRPLLPPYYHRTVLDLSSTSLSSLAAHAIRNPRVLVAIQCAAGEGETPGSDDPPPAPSSARANRGRIAPVRINTSHLVAADDDHLFQSMDVLRIGARHRDMEVCKPRRLLTHATVRPCLRVLYAQMDWSWSLYIEGSAPLWNPLSSRSRSAIYLHVSL